LLIVPQSATALLVASVSELENGVWQVSPFTARVIAPSHPSLAGAVLDVTATSKLLGDAVVLNTLNTLKKYSVPDVRLPRFRKLGLLPLEKSPQLF